MLLSYIINRVEDDDLAECLVFGLVFGLAVGLAGGLVVGLVGGLVVGLVVGLVGGLVVGLVVGLAGGLAEIYNTSIEMFIIILLLVFVVSEILFWCDKYKYHGLGRWGNTLLKKGESFFESSVVIINVVNVFIHYDDMLVFFGSQQENIKLVLSFVGYGTIIVLLVLGVVWLNSLKYKEKKCGKKKKP